MISKLFSIEDASTAELKIEALNFKTVSIPLNSWRNPNRKFK